MFATAFLRPLSGLIPCLLLCGITLAAPARAGTDPAAQSQPATGPAQAIVGAPDSDTRIIVDDKDHTVRIFAGGKEILTIDASGLHVNGDLTYSGTLDDTQATTTPIHAQGFEP